MDALEVYLQQHWAAAAGGRDLARRVASTHDGSDVGAPLDAIAIEVAEDQEALRSVMLSLGVRPQLLLPVVARVAERAGRLKPNGRLLHRSPVSDVLEVEALRAAVSGKRAVWDSLLAVGDDVEQVPVDEVRRLRQRADDQLERLARVHETLVRRCLAP